MTNIKMSKYKCPIHKTLLTEAGYKNKRKVYHCKQCKELYYEIFLKIVQEDREVLKALSNYKKLTENKQEVVLNWRQERKTL